jgi:adenylosuccinate synthase
MKTMVRRKVDVLVGGQYGSEGKGVIASYLANEYNAHIRVGGPNAGHSFIHGDNLFKMQSIPCGWINPDAKLLIVAGGLIDVEQMTKEIHMITEHGYADISNRLYIDKHCGVLSPIFKESEGGTMGEIHQRIGSTGKGVGAARAARMNRVVGTFKFAKDIPELQPYLTQSVSSMVNNLVEYEDASILIEGTQGAELSLIHCNQWPYCTSADTNAGQMIADVGISPLIVRNIIMVIRTYPIRVAGNSGPMLHETTWADLSRKIGKEIIEKTTVTKKVRRVGEWDMDLFKKAVTINRPTSIALNFIDYINIEDTGKTQYESLSSASKKFVETIEDEVNIPVEFIGTGGEKFSIIDRREII